MGEVFLAHDEQLDRQVVLKFLSPEFSDDEDLLRRFKQEARAASALNHCQNLFSKCKIKQLKQLES